MSDLVEEREREGESPSFSLKFCSAVEEEIKANDAALLKSIERTEDSGDVMVLWKNYLEHNILTLGESITIDLGDPELPEALKHMIENDFDVAREYVRRIRPGKEVRLAQVQKVDIGELSQNDVGKPREVEGLLARFDTDRNIKILKDAWECEQGHICRSLGTMNSKRCLILTAGVSTRGKRLPCGALLIRPLYTEQTRTDSISIKLEGETREEDKNKETFESSIEVVFDGKDLVNDVMSAIASSEKRLRVTGVVKLDREGTSGTHTMYIQGLNVERIPLVTESRFDNLVRRHIPPEQMRSHVMKLIRSFAPHIIGRTLEKTALLAQAVGSKEYEMRNGMTQRSDITILLIGNTSTGKTHLCKFQEQLRAGSIYAVGRGASGVGLTGGIGWGDAGDDSAKRVQVTRGPYAMANGAIAIVDEIHKRDPKDLEHLVSVMDDVQELIITKQGLNKRLPIRCGSLHAGNPRSNMGNYQRTQSFFDQADLPYWLYSRYDIICVMTQDEEAGNVGAVRHGLKEAFRITYEDELGESSSSSPENLVQVLERDTYPLEYMKAEIRYLRDTFDARLKAGTPEWDQIMDFWEKMTKSRVGGVDGDLASAAELFDKRKINSLTRVVEAVARIWRSNTVKQEHVDMTLSLFRDLLSRFLSVPGADQVTARFAQWLVRQQFQRCIHCQGRGCETCFSRGGIYLPVSLVDCLDYPYADEARKSWDYLIEIGGLIGGPTTFTIGKSLIDMASGNWKEEDEEEIALEALRLLSVNRYQQPQ